MRYRINGHPKFTQYPMLRKLFEDFNIKNISLDSRKVKTGDAFFAIKGTQSNGNDFISEAFNKGAKIVITDSKDSIKNNDRIFLVGDAKIAITEAAQILYPKLPKNLVAVTGTNGKSSVVSYFQQLAFLLGHQSASLGTLGLQCSKRHEDIQKLLDNGQSLTTPDPVSLRRTLHLLAENNIDYVALEASSHGLHQKRLHGIEFKVASLTSFSQDHLDYHGSMADYLQAKLLLFTQNLAPEGIAVINGDNPEINFITGFLRKARIKFLTIDRKGDIAIDFLLQSINRTEVNFTFASKKYGFTTDITGSFQASNLLIAVMMLHCLGVPIEKIVAEIPKVKAVKGRLQKIPGTNKNFNVFIDYAHTPDALEKSLSELKKLQTAGRLIVVFGCGGNRDKAKRSMMGEIAARLADYVIITDDNPRHEDPGLIRRDILSGSGVTAKAEIPDRADAIKHAIAQAKKDDIILIAGKGHEEYQIIGDKKIVFSDEQVVRSLL